MASDSVKMVRLIFEIFKNAILSFLETIKNSVSFVLHKIHINSTQPANPSHGLTSKEQPEDASSSLELIEESSLGVKKKFPLEIDQRKDLAIEYISSIQERILRLNPQFDPEYTTGILATYGLLLKQGTNLAAVILKFFKKIEFIEFSLKGPLLEEVKRKLFVEHIYYTDEKLIKLLFKHLWNPNRENFSLFELEPYRYGIDEKSLYSFDEERTQYHNILDFASTRRIMCDPSLLWDMTDQRYRLRMVEFMFQFSFFLKKAYDLIPSKIDFDNPLSFYRNYSGVSFPSIFGTKLICIYQEYKYDIRMEVGTLKELNRLISSNINEPFFGFIHFAPSSHLCDKHVTPLLVFPHLKLIFSLDSIAKTDPTLSNIPGYTLFSFKIPRQADRYNCRNDAINILSNGLSYLKTLFSSPPTQEEANALLRTWEETLPAQFLKTTQRKEAILKVDGSTVVRSKRNASLSDKIAQYLNPETKRREYLLQKGHKYAAICETFIREKKRYAHIWKRFYESLQVLENDGFSIHKPSFGEFDHMPRYFENKAKLTPESETFKAKEELIK